MNEKVIDPKTLSKLEETKKAVLQRVAKNLREQSESDQGSVGARHGSHSSGAGGRTHGSTVTS